MTTTCAFVEQAVHDREQRVREELVPLLNVAIGGSPSTRGAQTEIVDDKQLRCSESEELAIVGVVSTLLAELSRRRLDFRALDTSDVGASDH